MSEDAAGVRVTTIGSWPGTDLDLVARIVVTESPELPAFPELPARGPHTDMIGRATALLPGLDLDLQPSGWRLHHGRGFDQRRARQTLADDLDRWEEQTQGFSGTLKLAVAGPWTLAASIERPRGDKAVADPGARRDLAQSLAAGLGSLTDQLRRRMPQVVPVWQLDEPLLPAVYTGRVGTASGFGTHRSVDRAELVGALDTVIAGSGTPCWLHGCAAGMPYEVLQLSQVAVYGVDVALTASVQWDALAGATEQGRGLALGLPATTDRPEALARRALDVLDSLGLDQTVADRIWLTPTCGLAGSRLEDAVRAVRGLRTAARIVNDALLG